MAALLALAALTAPAAVASAQARADNPYAGARVYVNPEWSAKAAAEPGGSAVANQPTAVWLDRIAAIGGVGGGMGLRDHLDEALDQANGQPMVIQIVIYDLPGRDCAALASNGELGPNDLPRYKTEYIDVIADILADPAYASLRVVAIIEIDSLPNLVTNVSGRPTQTPQCDVMKANGGYVNGVGYALAQLGALSNVYNYLDAAHHGWIGWDDNFGATAEMLASAARASGSTVNNVTGFITNTANYSALVEPFFTINDVIAGRPIREAAHWIDFNRYVDELSFAQAFRARLVQAGFPSNIGMLIDTSRNGWGGTARPTGPGPSTSPDEYVNGGRLDRRIHLGNWCNQAGAGLGERPRAAPAAGIDAYVWVKPPGESDGSSTEIPNDEGKGFDRMCDPTYTGNPRNGNSMSGALGGAPLSGHWFPAQFQELMRNAFPPLNSQPPPVDTQAPTAPSGLVSTSQTSSSISLSWTASTDNVGVTEYRVFEGATQVGSASGPSTTVGGLAASSTHTYTVRAADAAGNVSAASNPATATTSAPGAASLKVQYRAGNQSVGDNQLGPHFNIVNTGTTTVTLSQVTLRYWYTVDGQRPQTLWCDYTPRGCGNVSGQFVALSPGSATADSYVQVSFAAGMGTLAPGQSTGEIQLRVSKDNWSNYNEANDYSFDASKTSFADSNRVTLYQGGTLVWGVPPAGGSLLSEEEAVELQDDAGCQASGGGAGPLAALLVGFLAWAGRGGRRRARAALSLLGVGLVAASLGACVDSDLADGSSTSGSSALAVSAGGVTVDVVATNTWQGGFNAAVRVANGSFAAPISSFRVVFRLAGGAGVQGTGWNGAISPPGASGDRTATSPDWLVHGPIARGQSFDVGFTGTGTFAGATISGLVVNGQTIPLDGSGGDDGGADDGSTDDGGTDDGSTDDGADDGGDDGGSTGYSTSGGKLFRNGTELRISGLNWFGLETQNRVLHGLWTGRQLASFLSDIKSKGFNALRLPLSPQTIRHGFPIDSGPWQGEDFAALDGQDGRTALEWTLTKAKQAGVFVLLDFHTCDPARLGAGLPGSPIACSGYSLQSWISDIQSLAQLSLSFDNVVGIDLTNEPHALTWSAWAGLVSQAGQAALAINPGITIWVEGVGNVSANGGFSTNWGGNLFEAGAISGIPANRLVFSPHAYGPSVSVQSYFSDPAYPDNMPGIWNTHFGHLSSQGFTVVVGEFGGHYTTSPTESQNDRLWQDEFVDYLLARGTPNNFYWAVNPNSGDTGGVLLDDWSTWNNDKVALLQRLMH
ncbi:MAG TPA: glycoside hydrolase family 6 protein [Kofleriaceae bacterium]|nr:glycoside hydrolase family 6 protein [Kofleriaceae bacterium]